MNKRDAKCLAAPYLHRKMQSIKIFVLEPAKKVSVTAEFPSENRLIFCLECCRLPGEGNEEILRGKGND